MITLQAITGLLIAAVLNVPGTGQHEVAQVENEPVVKEVKMEAATEVTPKKLATQWFEYTGPAKGTAGYDPLNPQNYTARGASSPGCSGSDQVCAIHVESQLDPNDPSREIPDEQALMALEDDINDQIPQPGVLEFEG